MLQRDTWLTALRTRASVNNSVRQYRAGRSYRPSRRSARRRTLLLEGGLVDKKHKSWLFPGSANRGRATPPATDSQDDLAEHGPIEDWFIRTKQHLLQS